MRIEPGPLADVATFSGQLDAEHSVMVKSEIEDVIASIAFEQGQEVFVERLRVRVMGERSVAESEPLPVAGGRLPAIRVLSV